MRIQNATIHFEAATVFRHWNSLVVYDKDGNCVYIEFDPLTHASLLQAVKVITDEVPS